MGRFITEDLTWKKPGHWAIPEKTENREVSDATTEDD